MKFICERDALADALAVVVARTKGADTMPILQHILVEVPVDGQSIRLTGNDLASSSQVTIKAEVEDVTAIAIPGERFNRVVAGLPEGAQVSVASTDKTATVRAGKASYQLPLLPPADFPHALVPREPIARIELDAKHVARLFKTPSSSILQDNSRPYLGGIYLHKIGDRLAAVATDGHTLVRVVLDQKPPTFTAIVVPDKACAEFVRIVGKDDSCVIEISENLASIEAGNRRFVTKLIDGKFPADYERVIPPAANAPLVVDSSEMDAAMQRIIAAHDPKITPVAKFGWSNGDEALNASLRTNFGQGEEKIDCDVVGERGEVQSSVQVAYVRDLIAALGGKRARFYFRDRMDPIRVENPDDNNIVGVLTPCW